MIDLLSSYLEDRSDTGTFLLRAEISRTIPEIFNRPESILPTPYKIFFADENQPPVLGFPVSDCAALRDIDTLLDRWLAEELVWQLKRESARERAQQAFTSYVNEVMKIAENALLSNLLADYHAIFWLTHSLDVSRHFSQLPRRISAVDTQAGRTQGDALKYRIFGRWAGEFRDQVSRMATRVGPILDGEEERAVEFFRILEENVLILTEEFIGPDMREVRSFTAGYLHREPSAFKEIFERIRGAAAELVKRDRAFRAAVTLFGSSSEEGVSVALLLDRRFQSFLFEHAAMDKVVNREEREQFQSLSRRITEFAVLNLVRRGIAWMTTSEDGDIASTDRRAVAYSRSTRPIDFGRPGVVDPMVHRFGLIYDISAFSETIGSLARGGTRGEANSYRQMLLFQRKLETVTERHRLQFEKFLGDGAFYTTRRALRLVRAAVEIQRFYSEMKMKGFAFNRGIRIALNYGYYRLLPMKGTPGRTERLTEFYGPGVIELSRLTTGKSNREIDEIQAFLIAHGYEPTHVQQFFAPLKRGEDMIDHRMHEREFYAYINANGHLVNEGIVASLALLAELSTELLAESQAIYRIRAPWATYIGFVPEIEGMPYVGVRLIGTVSLKGLEKVEVGEIVPFSGDTVETERLDLTDSFVTQLRHEFHLESSFTPTENVEHDASRSLVLCAVTSEDRGGEDVILGEWDRESDQLYHTIRMPRLDFQQLIGHPSTLSCESLEPFRPMLRQLFERADKLKRSEPLSLELLRADSQFIAFVLDDPVETLS